MEKAKLRVLYNSTSKVWQLTWTEERYC